MKILATAKPSMRYRWYASLSAIKLEARLRNNKVKYYEVSDKKEIRLSKESAKQCFPKGSIIDRPFLKKENEDFYAVLYRGKKKFREQFKALRRSPK